jgi:hypothetical protein
MSIKSCLDKLVTAGRVTQKAATDALALHEGMQGRLYPEMGPVTADAAAAREAARVMKQAAEERKLMAAKIAIREAEITSRMNLHTKGKTAGLFSALTRDIYEDGGQGEVINVESHSESVTKRLLRIAGALIEPYESKLAGLRQDTASIWNVVDELFHRDTGDQQAQAAAKGWEAATKYAVDRVKREGRVLSVLDDWRLPQFWDSTRARGFTQREFVNDLMREYDAGFLRVMDKQGHGEAPRAAVPGIVANAFDDIRLGRGQGAGGGFSNQLRVFRFDDPGAYRRLMSKYGPGDGGLYKMLMGHLGSMGREIAFVEVLGPQYERSFHKLFDVAQRDDAERFLPQVTGDMGRTGRLLAKAKASVKRLAPTRPISSPAALKRTYDYLAGNLGAVESDLMAGIFGGMRNLQTASRLGSAMISAIPGDSVTAGVAANYNGISATSVLARVVADLSVRVHESEEIARQLNLTAASVIQSTLGAKRFSDEIVGEGLSARMAETIIRAQGLQAWTEGLKRAFSMEFMGLIARQAELRFDDVDPAFRSFLDRYGFDADAWDKLRATPQLEAQGARFFDVNAVEDQRLADRLMSAVLDERQFAVIEPNARVKQLTTGGRARGTWWGEVARSTTMFKSFSMSIMMTHMMRAMTQGPWWQRAYRLTGFMALTTVAGAVTAQMGTIIAGRDPQDMKDPRFWMQAAIRGGGLGIYGDLAYSANTRGGEGVSELLLGPVFGAGVGAAGMIFGGDKASGKALAQYLKGWTPGSTLWFSKLATDRLIFDQFQAMMDPQYRESFARYEKRMKKEFGQAFWWRPGNVAPERGPDMGRAVGR